MKNLKWRLITHVETLYCLFLKSKPPIGSAMIAILNQVIVFADDLVTLTTLQNELPDCQFIELDIERGRRG